MHLNQSQTLFTIYHFITDTDFIAGTTCYDCALKTPAYQNVHRSSRIFSALKCLFRAKKHAQLPHWTELPYYILQKPVQRHC